MRTTVLLTLAVLFSATSAAKSQDPSETKATLQEEASKHVTSAVLLKKVNPEYPKKAKKAHVEGTVRLHFIVAKDGTVQNIEVISGAPLLVDASLKAVRQWRYQPTQINGKPVEIDTTIDVIFALHKNS
jgi:periplasmic protein TonB